MLTKRILVAVLVALLLLSLQSAAAPNDTVVLNTQSLKYHCETCT